MAAGSSNLSYDAAGTDPPWLQHGPSIIRRGRWSIVKTFRYRFPPLPSPSRMALLLSPGVSYLIQDVFLPRISFPLFISCAVYPFLIRKGHLPQSFSHGRIFAITLVGQGVIKSIWKNLSQYFDRKRLNARPVHKHSGRLPGDVDVVIPLMLNFKYEYPGEVLSGLKRRYGRSLINVGVLWEDVIWTDNPTFIKEIMVTDFPNYVKGPKFRRAMYSMLGNGIFNSDGETWKLHRSLTRPFFSRDRITDLGVFDEHAKLTMGRISERAQSGVAIDFQDVVSRFTMDTTGSFLFDVSINSISSPLPLPSSSYIPSSETDHFTTSFQAVLRRLVNRVRWTMSGWQLFEMFGDKTKADVKVLHAFVEPIVDAAVKRHREKRQGKDGGAGRETLLSHLVSVMDDKDMIRDELLNILIAGRDTTAVTLTFVAYFLAMHPDVLERLRKEVLDVVGVSQCPTYEIIKSMKYLRAVINETLRLFPPIPFNMKESVESRAWTDPDTGERFYIPAKTKILYTVITMGRDAQLWGSDAVAFSPERWLDERKHLQLANPFIFLPFQAGPRICIGQQFAYNEMSFFLIRLLQRFDGFELAPDAQPKGTLPPEAWKKAVGTRKPLERFMPKAHLTLYAEGGLWLRLQEAKRME